MLNTATFNVQWFLRLLALVVVGITLLYVFSRRRKSGGRAEEGVPVSDQLAGD